MKPTIFKVTTKVMVSNYDEQGYWIGNGETQVYAGTSLPARCTTDIYNPSAEGMIGKFDEETGKWTEIVNRQVTPFFDEMGNAYFCETIEAELPEGAIEVAPPEHDAEKFDAMYDREAGEWKLLESRIGQKYFDKFGNEQLVTASHFELPEGHTFEAPNVEAGEGESLFLVEGKWEVVKDYRNQIAYPKSEGEPFQVQEIGEVIPETHTMEEPIPYSEYVEGEGWVYKQDLERDDKLRTEREWTHEQIDAVINRLDQFERDQKYPEEFRVSPLNQDQYDDLIMLRHTLCSRSDVEGYPFDERPEIPSFV